MTVCSHCNSTNPDDAIFCNHCGASLTFEETPIEPVVTVIHPSNPSTSPPPRQNYYPATPPKDRSIALILEILPGLFGFLGFGWIYSGNITAGILWLVLFLVWAVAALFIIILTGGVGAICTLPVNIACVVISAISLSSYTKRHPEIFG